MVDLSYVEIGESVKIWHPEFVNIYGRKDAICKIGNLVNIGAFTEIGPGVIIGDRCHISAYCFIPEGVVIEDDCFIGPGVVFCNDKYPFSHRDQWEKTLVKKGASIGARATILPGIIIGEKSLIGAGSVVTRSVPNHIIVAGNPARRLK